MSIGRIEDNKLKVLAETIGRHQNLLTATQLAKEIFIEKTFIFGPPASIESLMGIPHTMNFLTSGLFHPATCKLSKGRRHILKSLMEKVRLLKPMFDTSSTGGLKMIKNNLNL